MALTHVDTDGGGSDTAPYDTWAKATAVIQTGLTAALAGGECFVQGAAADTAAATRTLTSPGTIDNPTKLIGVKDGTTNEGTSIVASDLAVRGTDTLPHFESTGAGNDVTLAGYLESSGMKFSADDFIAPGTSASTNFVGCELASERIINCRFNNFINCGYFISTAGANSGIRANAVDGLFYMSGGEITAAGSLTRLFPNSVDGIGQYSGVDLSSLTFTNIFSGGAQAGQTTLRNCRMPSSFGLIASTPTNYDFSLTLIGCDNAATHGATDSIPDYEYTDFFGSIDGEFTIVRTGGADDGASGLFSYAMTPRIDKTLESTTNSLKSPWMDVWLEAGSNTLTIYIANDTASTDFNEDDVWVEFYTPDAGDTAQHDQTFDPALERLLVSSTIITDDTGSTWGTGGNNHQKMSVTVTTGFEGVAYVRLHFAKRYSSSPTTLYLDPFPEVS